MAPSSIPLVKCFCMNGYTTIIGRLPAITAAICMAAVGTVTSACSSLDWVSSSMLRITTCSGCRWVSVMYRTAEKKEFQWPTI
ncbi:hypothetical protein D3C73_1604390 [compost metagenome]